MPAPTPDWTMVTVHGTYKRTDGSPSRGKVVFTPRPRRFMSVTSQQTVNNLPIIAVLDSEGTFSVQVPATDDPDIIPSSFSYNVRELFTGGREYDILVPSSAAGTGVDITEVAPLQNPAPGNYPVISGGPPGPQGPQGPQGLTGPQGPAGAPGVGTSALTIVTGGTVNLDDETVEGDTLGFRVKSSTTFVGEGGASVLPAGVYTFERTEDGWVHYKATGGIVLGVAPDTTPPSAITGFNLVANGDGTVTGTWNASTDASEVSYGWRIWLTAGGATGSYTTVAGTQFTTGVLDPGDYSGQVYAFDEAGNVTSAALDTVTVVPPAGWSTLVLDTFTASDNTLVAGRVTDGATWSNADNKAVIISNEVVLRTGGTPESASSISITPTGLGGADAMEVWASVRMAQEPDSSIPNLQLQFTDCPVIRLSYGNGTELAASIVGFNAGVSYTTLLAAVKVTDVRTGKFGMRKTGNVFEILKADGTVVGTLDVTDGYSGYKDKPIPGTATYAMSAWKSSGLTEAEIRVYS